MAHEFDAVLQRLEGKIAWTVFYMPFSVLELYGTPGRFKVKGTVDGHLFNGTLLPSRNGHYLVYNQAMRSGSKKKVSDAVHVVVEPDAAPRVITIPADVSEALESSGAMAAFQGHPYYQQREELVKIDGAKQPETRSRRIQDLCQKLLQVRGNP